MDKALQLKLATIEDELKKLVRRQDEMQHSLDLLFADRSILEEITGSVKHLQEIILQHQVHQDNIQKDMKQEIRESGVLTENTVHNIENKLDEKTILIKSKSENIFSKIKSKLASKI